MKKKIILTISFLLSLSPMLLSQYGGMKGVSEISGLINLINPIGILSLIIYFIGIWLPTKSDKLNFYLGLLGTMGMVISELYKFLTWHILTISGSLSLQANIQTSMRLAFPEFYLGLIVSLAMIAAYVFIYNKVK